MPKFLKILLYPLIFFVATLVFVFLLFPYDSVKTRVAREIEKAMGGAYQISIGKLSPDFPSGAHLKNVEMKPRGEAAAPIQLNTADLKFALLPLLSGTMEVDFDLRPPQGRATGSYAVKKGGGLLLNLKADRFDLGMISFLIKDAGIPLSGMISGDIALEIYDQDPLRNNGKINLQILDLALGEVSLAEGFKLPAIKLASQGAGSRVDAAINRGNFEVKAFTLTGGDLSLDTNGKIYGARKADNYRFNLKGTFKVSPEFADKFQILALVDKQKQADGAYPFTITGRVLKPNIRIGDFKLPL